MFALSPLHYNVGAGGTLTTTGIEWGSGAITPLANNVYTGDGRIFLTIEIPNGEVSFKVQTVDGPSLNEWIL